MFGKFRFQDISRTYWNPNQFEERYRKASTTTAIFHWNFLKFKIFFHGRRLADASLGIEGIWPHCLESIIQLSWKISFTE